MHRALPERPSLEYLKNEAKDLLAALRKETPDAKLAQAQHALARQYGFASWPRLRRHVEDASFSASPFTGTWKASLPDSIPHPAQRFRGATLDFSIRHDVLTIAQILVNESGVEERSTTALHVDGCEHVSDDRPGLSLVATWRGPRAFRVVATQDGKAVGAGTYEVSADGRRLSVTTDDMHLVFEREARPASGMAASLRAAITLLVCALALSLPAEARAQGRPFTLHQVAPNVWAAVGGVNAETGANAGFVIGEDGVAVIDAFASSAGASQLLAEIRRLTPLPIRFVINTHHHLDHVAGNAVFVEAGATVVAHRNVQGWIRTENLRLLDTAGAAAPPQLRAAIERLSPPHVGFDGEVRLQLGSRAIHVRHLPGHTGGDSVITIPDARVVFTGDLFWHRSLPNLIDATTASWIETLDVLAADRDHAFVPGHGEVARAQDVTAFRDYLATLRRTVSEARTRQLAGEALAEAVRPLLAKSYKGWAFFEYLLAPNILHMEQELGGTKRVPR